MYRMVFILLWFLCSVPLVQANTATLSIETWQFDDIEANNLQLSFSLTENGITVQATANKISLPEPFHQITNVGLNCHSVVIKHGEYICQRGMLSFYHVDFGQQELQFKVDAFEQKGAYRLRVSNVNIANNRLRLNLVIRDQGWQAGLSGSQTSLHALLVFFQRYLPAEVQHQLSRWQFDDQSSFTLDLTATKETISRAKLNLIINHLNLNDEQGLYVGELVSGNVIFDVRKKNKIWYWQSDVLLNGGQAYIEPVFFDFTENKLTLTGSGYWRQENNTVAVEQLVFDHDKILTANAELVVKDSVITSLNIRSEETDANRVYQHWLQPFTVGTAVDNVMFEGMLGFDYKQSNSYYDFTLTVNQLSAHDAERRFSISGLSGQFAWTDFNQPVESDLYWQTASLYAIPIGASSFKAQTHNAEMVLIEPWLIPVLDGQLHISSLDLNRQQETTHWSFDGLLSPISMDSLSETLGWPQLHGKLSGVIPKVSYQNQQIDIDGALMVKLFDGTAIFKDLKLERPFDSLPQLYGNIDLLGLDLETITSTFEFGKITGKLDGKVENLRLSNWQPVYFDASIATPKGDKSRRRISQQAIDNLSQVGGGATGILSKSFLRFFEDFSYQKIGLSCKLRNEVCTISGVEESDKGYYIVKGGGLPPRINVMGYTRRVDWPELISRLKAVSNSSGAVIK